MLFFDQNRAQLSVVASWVDFEFFEKISEILRTHWYQTRRVPFYQDPDFGQIFAKSTSGPGDKMTKHCRQEGPRIRSSKIPTPHLAQPSSPLPDPGSCERSLGPVVSE